MTIVHLKSIYNISESEGKVMLNNLNSLMRSGMWLENIREKEFELGKYMCSCKQCF
ncbi:MAG: hypothetical protein CM15mP58_22830 [Burkholderiaceae bacterium]|nr:MAG: hypothetical protein CM15mP58_22830 [Burkholderiaceae bacterium]